MEFWRGCACLRRERTAVLIFDRDSHGLEVPKFFEMVFLRWSTKDWTGLERLERSHNFHSLECWTWWKGGMTMWWMETWLELSKPFSELLRFSHLGFSGKQFFCSVTVAEDLDWFSVGCPYNVFMLLVVDETSKYLLDCIILCCLKFKMAP